MKTKVIERNELIATRVPPGDRWTLVDDSKNIVHKTLTDALEAYLGVTNFKGEYRLDPIGSKLYAINTQEVKVEKPKDDDTIPMINDIEKAMEF